MTAICVYCGSKSGVDDKFVVHARLLGKALLAEKISLVYGGADIGLMGEIADTVIAGGGKVTGVIPKILTNKEITNKGLTKLIVVESLHERKKVMEEISDGFIALPGGFGTLDELFEILSWYQLGVHHKPCGLLNTEGYYDNLLKFLDHSVKEQFVSQSHVDRLIVENNVSELLKTMLHNI
jgi:hypothetical protein